jgi:hypothetical protein
MDVMAKARNYVTNIYPPTSGDLLGNGSYGENFNNKAVFS